MNQHGYEQEEDYSHNDKIDAETNRELSAVYRRMNFIVRLYNSALLRVLTLEEENRKLKETQMIQGNDIKNIKESLGEIADNTKWTRRALYNAILVAGIGAVVTMGIWLVQRGF